MIKMVATDIDGTILNWDFNFSPEVINCIKRLTAGGIKVCLITGRMHLAALKLAQKLELDTPIVSYQGGLIKDNKGNTLYEKTMDVDRAKEIIKWAKKNNVHINLYMDDSLYVENDNIAIKRYTGERFIPYKVCNFDDLEIKNVNKILAIDFENPDKVTSWVKYLKSIMPELYIVKSTPYFCEVSNPDAKKSCAVEFLQKYYDIKKEETLSIGDQDNDIELLKAGGVAVAMGNASENLKKCANYITDTIDNNGFVKAIEKFCFVK